MAMLAWCVGIGAAVGRDIHRLDDYELFAKAAGVWEGVGVSFEIAPNAELKPAITYRDTWEASLAESGRLMVMNGVTRSGGRKIEYVWRFRWHPEVEKVTAEFENSLGEASTMEVNVVADGKRLELRTPRSSEENDQSAMHLDIYLEDEEDLVIEVSIHGADGEETYRSAARYQESEREVTPKSKSA
ncbi:MAG: hypothetical protein KDN19_14750 [Verrucomicrobiae bacterium]|nr:hypothetical protein [Verrucomicrobiae bacterium]